MHDEADARNTEQRSHCLLLVPNQELLRSQHRRIIIACVFLETEPSLGATSSIVVVHLLEREDTESMC